LEYIFQNIVLQHGNEINVIALAQRDVTANATQIQPAKQYAKDKKCGLQHKTGINCRFNQQLNQKHQISL